MPVAGETPVVAPVRTHVKVATAQLSAVVGLSKVIFVLQLTPLAEAVTSAGQVIVGFTISVTTTVKEQLAMLPDASVAFQVTVVVPRLKATLCSEVPVPKVAPVSV